MKIHPALPANVYRVVATADRSARPSSSARRSRCLIDEGLPSRSTTRCTLAHGLKLGGDLLKRAVRCGGGNAGDQPKQPIIPVLWPGAIQQVRLDDAFGDQSPDGAAEPLGGPGCRPAAVQDPHHVAPGLARAHAPYGRQPRVQMSQNAIQMRGVAACPDLANGVPIAGVQARIAADATSAARSLKAGLGAFGDKGAFELSDRPQHLQGEHPLWRRGVDRVSQAAKMPTAGFKLLNDGEQVADRAGEAIEPDHDEGLAGADLAQQARQHGAAAIGAGGVLLEDRLATGGAQFVALRICTLLLGGDPRIADQTAWCGGIASCCLNDEVGPPEPAFLQINKVPVNARLQRWPRIGSRSDHCLGCREGEG